MKFNKSDFRKLIKNEIKKILDDDMLREPPALGEPHYAAYKTRNKVCQKCGKSPCECHDEPADPSICGSCRVNPCECGYADIMEQKLTCTSCGGILFLEGDCGCQSKIPLHVPEATHAYEEVYDDSHDMSGAYMAKSQLHKLAKYAQKLQHMIPDDHNLEDWMRTHISQASDDIGEVYHKLDYQEIAHKNDH
jgi:hypothetical protein